MMFRDLTGVGRMILDRVRFVTAAGDKKHDGGQEGSG
jgi:hypothetical protein